MLVLTRSRPMVQTMRDTGKEEGLDALISGSLIRGRGRGAGQTRGQCVPVHDGVGSGGNGIRSFHS